MLFIENVLAQVDTIDLKRYQCLTDSFRNGRRDYSNMPFLVHKAIALKDSTLARGMADDYIDNYLLKLPDSVLYSKANMDFIRLNIWHSDSKGFTFCFRNHKRIDQVLGQPNAVWDVVKYIVSKEQVDSLLINAYANNTQPSWKTIKKMISRKCNSEFADEIILDARIRWFGTKQSWKFYAHAIVEKVSKFGPFGLFDEPFQYNTLAWEVFQKTADKNDLQTALLWSYKAMNSTETPNAAYLDTYANLLYKIGRRKEAMEWEERALRADSSFTEIKENLNKMKNEVPTWPTL